MYHCLTFFYNDYYFSRQCLMVQLRECTNLNKLSEFATKIGRFCASRNSNMMVHMTLNDPLCVTLFAIFKAQAYPTKKLSQIRQSPAAVIKRK